MSYARDQRFEDGSGVPNLDGWGRWQPTLYGVEDDPGAIRDCGIHSALAYGSKLALMLDFALKDPANGKPEDVGAKLATFGPRAMDLSGYQRFVFSAVLAPGVPAPPLGAQLAVELNCKTVPAELGNRTNELRVDQGAAIATAYHRFELELANFGQPGWVTNHIKGGTPECLSRVDSIGFDLFPTLADGQEAQGKLVIDDIFFDTGEASGCAP